MARCAHTFRGPLPQAPRTGMFTAAGGRCGNPGFPPAPPPKPPTPHPFLCSTVSGVGPLLAKGESRDTGTATT